MTLFKHHKTLGLMPWERFVTTYSRDYNPPRERHPQVDQMRPRTEAAPALINSPQTDRETWPIFHQYFYKTTNSTYGSSGCSQLASCSLLPPFLPPFGTFAPSVSEASGVVGSTLTGARTQDVRAARETGLLLGEEENGQLHYVFGGKVDALEQQEAKDEPQQKIDVLYEEGVIVLSTHVGPACCEDFLQPACREAWLQHLLHLPVVSSSVITFKDAESWDNSARLRSLKPAIGLKNCTVLRPSSRQYSCCAWETECPNSCCYKTQTFPPGVPRGSTLPLARVQPAVSCTEPSGEPWLTEYQSSYAAVWAQPKIQQSDLHCHLPPHHEILYPSH